MGHDKLHARYEREYQTCENSIRRKFLVLWQHRSSELQCKGKSENKLWSQRISTQKVFLKKYIFKYNCIDVNWAVSAEIVIVRMKKHQRASSCPSFRVIC